MSTHTRAAQVIVVCAGCQTTQSEPMEHEEPGMAEVIYTLCARCVARRLGTESSHLSAVPVHARFEFSPARR